MTGILFYEREVGWLAVDEPIHAKPGEDGEEPESVGTRWT